MKENSIIMRMYRPPISGHGVRISIPNDITIEKFLKKASECINKLGCDYINDSIIINIITDDKTINVSNIGVTYSVEYDSNEIVSWCHLVFHNIDNDKVLAVSYNIIDGCSYLTKNPYGFIERHRIKLLFEILRILDNDDEVVKQPACCNYIKPVENISERKTDDNETCVNDSSTSETKEENIKIDTTDNRFVYDELIWNPDVDIDVIRFISQYNNDDEFSKNARDYDYKYSYHFAKLLKSIFDRGTVCYSTCYNKFVWCDDDGLSYCVKGNICMLRSGKLIPENKIPKTIIEFFKNPNCEDYYEKLHIFGYYMKSLLSE